MLFSCSRETKLYNSIATLKRDRNRNYLMSLQLDNLLLPFKNEAGLYSMTGKKTDFHWGWDSPLSHIRGTFTGHWLSACAKIYYNENDKEIKLKADKVVDEIALCQKEHGNGWAFPIPENHLHWLKRLKRTWAPQYVCHKVMMGLLDMYLYANNNTALEVLNGCADWFYNFTNDISRETMSDMMDIEETGGIMELWADLYSVTKNEKHLELVKRYERPNLFEPLLMGVDVLTNMHANTTIPEIHGAARAYEVTGDVRYRKMVEAYWDFAVEKREPFVTGSQTSGEVWTPPGMHKNRLNNKNQEHCVVYNMMRLSEYLFRWTGDSKYCDYYEKNFYNGILAQGFFEENIEQENHEYITKKGYVTYYLPLDSGSKKVYSSATDHFWCCQCTLVQANAVFHETIYYKDAEENIYISQFLPSELNTTVKDDKVFISQKFDSQSGESIKICETERTVLSRPNEWRINITINGNEKDFSINIRNPKWASGPVKVIINGEEILYETNNGFINIKRTWKNDTITVIIPKALTAYPLADDPATIAFLDGPVALAGLCNEEKTLYGDINNLSTILAPHNERQWTTWLPYFKTVGQPTNIKFVPLYEIGNETYTVYFPVENKN